MVQEDKQLRGQLRGSGDARASAPAPRARTWPTWCNGVTKGYEKKLELVGVGFRAAVQGKALNLTLGFSHPVSFAIPEGITHRDAEPDRDPDQGHRPAEGRPDRRRDPRHPPAGALQGQGRALRGREDHPERRRRRSNEHHDKKERAPAPRACKTRAKIRELGVAAPDRAPHAAAHLCAGVRCRGRARCWPRPRPCRRRCARGLKGTGNVEAAKAVGRAIAERAKAAGVSKVAFDRSGFQYHGRVKALADAAREAGLEF